MYEMEIFQAAFSETASREATMKSMGLAPAVKHPVPSPEHTDSNDGCGDSRGE